MLEDMLALANSVACYQVALSSGMYDTERTAEQHGTARHSSAPHDRARHRTALNGVAPRR